MRLEKGEKLFGKRHQKDYSLHFSVISFYQQGGLFALSVNIKYKYKHLNSGLHKNLKDLFILNAVKIEEHLKL